MRAAFLAVLFLIAAASARADERIVQVDKDGDGRKETTESYLDGELAQTEIDKDGDGRADERIYFSKGRRSAQEADSNRDGRLDRWETYTPYGKIARVSKDVNADEKPDVFITMVSGRDRIAKEIDRNFDDQIDRREVWEAVPGPVGEAKGHRLASWERDDDFDGNVDAAWDRKDPSASAKKKGKPMQPFITRFAGEPPPQLVGIPEYALPQNQPGMRRQNQDSDENLTETERRVKRLNAKYGLQS
jgi:hypothetical protein